VDMRRSIGRHSFKRWRLVQGTMARKSLWQQNRRGCGMGVIKLVALVSVRWHELVHQVMMSSIMHPRIWSTDSHLDCVHKAGMVRPSHKGVFSKPCIMPAILLGHHLCIVDAVRNGFK
jgi:hypothetical protein